MTHIRRRLLIMNQQGRKVGDGVEDRVGSDAGFFQLIRPEFSGAHEHPAEPRVLAAADIGFQIISEHHRIGGRDPHAVQGEKKEFRGRFSDQCRFALRSVFDRGHDRSHVEAETVGPMILAVVRQRHEGCPVVNKPERAIERGISEFVTEIADQDRLRRGFHELNALQIFEQR